jgi:outer membrane protein with beta-barrel domain
MTARVVSAFAVVATCLAASAPAQTPRVEVTGGIQVTRASEHVLAPGWSVDVAVNPGARWGVIGEVSGARDTEHDADLDTVRLTFYTAAGGARWSPRTQGRLALFVQLLAGAARVSASAHVRAATIGETSTAFMVQPGGGMHVALTRKLGWVTQFDYRRVAAGTDMRSPGRHEIRLNAMIRAAF